MTAVADSVPATQGAAPGLEARLRAELRGEVAFDDYSRHLFSRDASMYAILPAGVVFPVDADDVAATVRIAREFGVTASSTSTPWHGPPACSPVSCRTTSTARPHRSG